MFKFAQNLHGLPPYSVVEHRWGKLRLDWPRANAASLIIAIYPLWGQLRRCQSHAIAPAWEGHASGWIRFEKGASTLHAQWPWEWDPYPRRFKQSTPFLSCNFCQNSLLETSEGKPTGVSVFREQNSRLSCWKPGFPILGAKRVDESAIILQGRQAMYVSCQSTCLLTVQISIGIAIDVKSEVDNAVPNTHVAKQPQNYPPPPVFPQPGVAVPPPGQNKILTRFEIVVFQYSNTPADNLVTRNRSHGKVIETDRLV